MIFLLIKGREEHKRRGSISLDKRKQCAFTVHSNFGGSESRKDIL